MYVLSVPEASSIDLSAVLARTRLDRSTAGWIVRLKAMNPRRWFFYPSDKMKGENPMKKLFSIVLTLILTLSIPSAALADAQARTLDEIKESGKLVIGVFYDKKP